MKEKNKYEYMYSVDDYDDDNLHDIHFILNKENGEVLKIIQKRAVNIENNIRKLIK